MVLRVMPWCVFEIFNMRACIAGKAEILKMHLEHNPQNVQNSQQTPFRVAQIG